MRAGGKRKSLSDEGRARGKKRRAVVMKRRGEDERTEE